MNCFIHQSYEIIWSNLLNIVFLSCDAFAANLNFKAVAEALTVDYVKIVFYLPFDLFVVLTCHELLPKLIEFKAVVSLRHMSVELLHIHKGLFSHNEQAYAVVGLDFAESEYVRSDVFENEHDVVSLHKIGLWISSKRIFHLLPLLCQLLFGLPIHCGSDFTFVYLIKFEVLDIVLIIKLRVKITLFRIFIFFIKVFVVF